MSSRVVNTALITQVKQNNLIITSQLNYVHHASLICYIWFTKNEKLNCI